MLNIVFIIDNPKKESVAAKTVTSDSIYVTWRVIEQFLRDVVHKPVNENNLELANILIKNILHRRISEDESDFRQLQYKNTVFSYSSGSQSLYSVEVREFEDEVEWKFMVPDNFSYSENISDHLKAVMTDRGIIPELYKGRAQFIGTCSNTAFVVDTVRHTVVLSDN